MVFGVDRTEIRDIVLNVNLLKAVVPKIKEKLTIMQSRNPLSQGVSMLGEVLETRNQELRVHLCCDDEQDVNECQWIPFTPATNHLMYAMPEVGTLVSVCMSNTRGWNTCFCLYGQYG